MRENAPASTRLSLNLPLTKGCCSFCALRSPFISPPSTTHKANADVSRSFISRTIHTSEEEGKETDRKGRQRQIRKGLFLSRFFCFFFTLPIYIQIRDASSSCSLSERERTMNPTSQAYGSCQNMAGRRVLRHELSGTAGASRRCAWEPSVGKEEKKARREQLLSLLHSFGFILPPSLSLSPTPLPFVESQKAEERDPTDSEYTGSEKYVFHEVAFNLVATK